MQFEDMWTSSQSYNWAVRGALSLPHEINSAFFLPRARGLIRTISLVRYDVADLTV